MIYDVVIIGAGVVGGAVARELSRYNLSIVALEKEADVCCGISKANTGIIHSPALIKKETKKAEYTIRGNLMFNKMSRELGFQVQWPGALILAYSEEDKTVLEKYKSHGEYTREKFSAGEVLYRYVNKDELLKKEPSLSRKVIGALHVPDAGRVIPYEFGIALWENAVSNGVQLKLNQTVVSLEKDNRNHDEELWVLKTAMNEYRAKYVVNAAGHGSNELGLQAGFPDSHIQKVKGQYLIYDRNRNLDIQHILFQVPLKGNRKAGKGILVCKTVYGNLMIGPDARLIEDENDRGTDRETLLDVLRGAERSVEDLDAKKVIKTFSGIRPKPAGGDFIIESHNHFYHLCGIESPGLTSSPAIGEDILKMMVRDGLDLSEKSNFNPFRKAIISSVLDIKGQDLKTRVEYPDSHPDQIICRCEVVPRSRITDALSRGIPVLTIDGVKRRTRAGQGRCQGAFCGKRVRRLLSQENHVPEESITQRGSESPHSGIAGKDLFKG
ncbi:MAG: FAD-dependent oxidoreductase [Spirochaetaceae bacterium]|nr:FAD-dependent oxidoreductase [Spirochaetaceae bacterium]